jgi:hypothetical protein
MIYQKMLEIFQMLLMIINKGMLFQQDKSMIHNQRLSSKIILCNQEMESIQSCFQKNQRNMTFLKMLETYQMLPTIINKETLFQQVRNTIHNQRPISKIMPCNLEMESIQSCSTNKKVKIRTWSKVKMKKRIMNKTLEMINNKIIMNNKMRNKNK